MGRRLIDADTVVHWQTYDDEHETFPEHEGTIADFLDQMTDEGCPESVDAVPVVRCKDCNSFSHGYCRFHDAKFVRPDGYCYWRDGKEGDNG